MSNPNLYYDLIEKPLVTEKATVLQDIRNQFTFRVHDDANKREIRKAIETLFGVKVEKVNVLNMAGKLRKFRGVPARTPGWRKAIVTLREGDKIEFV